MHFLPLNLLLLALSISLSSANPADSRIPQPKAYAAALPAAILNRRQDVPTSYTTSRSANTEFAPPGSTGTSYLETQTTTRTANTQIAPGTVTTPASPLVTTDSRTANTQAVGPSTGSTAGGMPAVHTGAVRMDRLMGVGILAVGVAGLV
ncbi:hypothetical protein K491DRAFT_677604 [Lophiostoma macrostomum CBS 122681]|uniref:Uncharacterized protein n=1 Tax=Lophiostoma macrostomum CBS 122681 TaxID=1314788 RepID=A0A6A6TAX4_9PLEO|nr:hypothetical protein K491DRAFT_677604 [Lophiostoma macrostomum CBS 122681]